MTNTKRGEQCRRLFCGANDFRARSKGKRALAGIRIDPQYSASIGATQLDYELPETETNHRHAHAQLKTCLS